MNRVLFRWLQGRALLLAQRRQSLRRAGVQSMKDFKTGKIYTYGEFKNTFSNLCR
jgi:hypothetical protein